MFSTLKDKSYPCGKFPINSTRWGGLGADCGTGFGRKVFSMKPTQKNQRHWKNILINRRVQIRITAINLIFMIVVVGLNTAVMLSSSLCNIYYSEGSRFWQVLDMYALSSEILTLSLTAAFVLAFICQLIVTHQVCGPLVNFKNSFDRISQGDLTRKVCLRKNDLLKAEALQFNQMLDHLSARIEDVKNDNRMMAALLHSMAEDPDASKSSEKARRFTEQHAESIQSHLSQLKLPLEATSEN
jgi:methyl-accepting chemotaxis protein